MNLYNHVFATHPASELTTSFDGFELIKFFESCRLKSYQDSGGVWTIGFGSIRGVGPNMTISMEEAVERLREDVRDHERYVQQYVTQELSQYEFDALVSWTFNLGGGALKSSTMLKCLNGDDMREVPYQMMRWCTVGGTWLRGLAKRRHAEALMFDGQNWEDHREFKGFNKRRYLKFAKSAFV